MKKYVAVAVAILVCVAFASTAGAQQRPLVTQDPETIGTGRILVEGGLDYGTDMFFPVSGLKGNLLRLPVVGVIVGVGPIAEVQVIGSLRDRLAITHQGDGPLADLVQGIGSTTTDMGDVLVGMKLSVLAESESHPAFAVRFATRLPTEGTSSGIGTGTVDFYASALGAKTVESFRIVGNLGLGVLTDPIQGDRHNNVLTFGGSLARALTSEIEVVGEINGRASFRAVDLPGTESRATMRFGARYTRGPARVDAAALLGMTSRDPGVGFTVGVTYIFEAFKVK